MEQDLVSLAAALRQSRALEEQKRVQAATQGGAATGTTQGNATMGGASQSAPLAGVQQQYQQPQQPQPNMLQTAADGYKMYNNVQKARGMAGALSGGTGASGFQLGGTLAGEGAGTSGLGGMLGSYGASSAPASFGTLGSTSSGGLASMLGGGNAATAGASTGYAGAGAGGAAGGLAGAGGMLAGLGALSFLGDKEMNENKGSIINSDKLNKMGTVGNSGIGLRGGDLVNGFNPATWASDPKKAGKGLVNAFTFGLFDKLM